MPFNNFSMAFVFLQFTARVNTLWQYKNTKLSPDIVLHFYDSSLSVILFIIIILFFCLSILEIPYNDKNRCAKKYSHIVSSVLYHKSFAENTQVRNISHQCVHTSLLPSLPAPSPTPY